MLRSFYSPASSPSTPSEQQSKLPLEQRLIRVTQDDIAKVTAQDIQRVRAGLTDEQLSSAIAIMLEANRFADVLIASSAVAWAEATTGVTEVQMGITGRVIRDRMSLLYNMLPYVSDEFLTTMGGSYTNP